MKSKWEGIWEASDKFVKAQKHNDVLIFRTRIQPDTVIEKDIKSVHPTLFQPTVNSADFDKLTLDNLKALRDKAKRAYEYHRKLKDVTGIESALNDYKMWDDELTSSVLLSADCA
jgi:hypothetical protein